MSSGGDTSSGNPTEKEKTDALYEDREPKKIIRIITVTAYMFSVSFVGIVLSAYYIFLWHPPNPRMMHAQAMNVHSEAQVDLLVGTSTIGDGLSRMAKLPEGVRTIDMFNVRSGNEKTKTRREILKNVNAVLRADFEKNKSNEAPPLMNAAPINNSIMSLNIDKKSSIFNSESSSTISSTSEILKLVAEKSSTTNPKTTTSTLTMTSTKKSTQNPRKKHHQAPFALKHLEVPIKQDDTRRRSIRITTATTSTIKGSLTTLDEKGASLDKVKPLTATTIKFTHESDMTNPQHTVKNLFKTLTTPLRSKDGDDSSFTDLPELVPIPSDKFQAVPQANIDNYPDSTIEPEDDLLDD